MTPQETIAAIGLPKSNDRDSLITWVLGLAVTITAIVTWQLWRKMTENAKDCRAENAVARAEATAAREQNERLYQEAIAATAKRERTLAEVVERNTAAWNRHAETIKTHFGSDYYRAVREQRNPRPDDDGPKPHRAPRPPTQH
jgi:hypothetical protein